MFLRLPFEASRSVLTCEFPFPVPTQRRSGGLRNARRSSSSCSGSRTRSSCVGGVSITPGSRSSSSVVRRPSPDLAHLALTSYAPGMGTTLVRRSASPLPPLLVAVDRHITPCVSCFFSCRNGTRVLLVWLPAAKTVPLLPDVPPSPEGHHPLHVLPPPSPSYVTPPFFIIFDGADIVSSDRPLRQLQYMPARWARNVPPTLVRRARLVPNRLWLLVRFSLSLSLVSLLD